MSARNVSARLKTMKKILRKSIEALIGKDAYISLWKATIKKWANKKMEKEIQDKNESSILEYKEKFNPKIFIETGTYKGDMVRRMSSRFEKIYSIELSDDLYTKAREKFAHFSHIEILNGDSGIVLPKLLRRIKEPALFWLDAHYSTGETVRGSLDTPVEQELRAILSHPVRNHVILIDDAREFVGKNGYPPIANVEKMARENGYLFEMKNDNIRLYPKKYDNSENRRGDR